MVSQALRRKYIRWSSTYDETAEAWEYRTPHVLASHVRDLLPAAARILDCGCGTGLNGRQYVGASLVGVDMALPMLSRAHERGYACVSSDIRSLPFRDATFDAVLCAAVLDEYLRLEPFIAEMTRVVRPGALIAFTTFSDRDTRWHIPLSRVRDVLVKMDLDLLETFRYRSHRASPDVWSHYRATIARKHS